MDSSNINNWTKVSDITDRGGWYTKSNNTEFFSAGCDRAEIMLLSTEDQTSFLEDNTLLDFKNLSVREDSTSISVIRKYNLNTVFRLE